VLKGFEPPPDGALESLFVSGGVERRVVRVVSVKSGGTVVSRIDQADVVGRTTG